MNNIRAPADPEIKETIKREYEKGAKPKELAEKYNVSINTLKSWIKRGSWGKASSAKSAPQNKKVAPPKKKGAPLGNHNAAGCGAPKNNRNAVKHGGYSEVYWDVLSPEEKALLDIPEDEEVLLMEQIRMFTIRERRLMQAINRYSDKELYVSGVMKIESKRKFKSHEEESAYNAEVQKKVNKRERMPGESFQVTTNTGATIDLISRLEREMTSVQSKKTKAISSLAKLKLEKQKVDDAEKGDAAADDWIIGVMGGDIDGEE